MISTSNRIQYLRTTINETKNRIIVVEDELVHLREHLENRRRELNDLITKDGD